MSSPTTFKNSPLTLGDLLHYAIKYKPITIAIFILTTLIAATAITLTVLSLKRFPIHTFNGKLCIALGSCSSAILLTLAAMSGYFFYHAINRLILRNKISTEDYHVDSRNHDTRYIFMPKTLSDSYF